MLLAEQRGLVETTSQLPSVENLEQLIKVVGIENLETVEQEEEDQNSLSNSKRENEKNTGVEVEQAESEESDKKEEENGTDSDSKHCNINSSSAHLHFTHVPYGFQQRGHFVQNQKLTDFVDVTYNERTREFIFLDTRGISTWNKDSVDNTITRVLSFPKYQFNCLRKIVFAKKYSVYFCLNKDFSLTVLNRNYDETCTVTSDMSSVMFLLFNPVRDELITGGVKGTRIWEYRQVADSWTEIRPMANYRLFLKKELKEVGGSWVKKVELELSLQHLYCCSENEVHCYDMEGNVQFKLLRAHRSTINGCKYSPKARLLVTCSNDCEVKVWGLTGGLLHTFRGHSRAVTNLMLHPDSSTLVLTTSLDGTVKMWSLDTMELFYSMNVTMDPIHWMGLTSEPMLWTATPRDLSVWSFNRVACFWALARSRLTHLAIEHGHSKTSRVMAIGQDNSIRLVSLKGQKNLSTVLPPPSVSPLQNILAVSYSREYSLVYLLINHFEVWVYTTRTDPSCRTAVWKLDKIQEKYIQRSSSTQEASARSKKSKSGQVQGVTSAKGFGMEMVSQCHSITTMNRPAMYMTEEGEYASPEKTNFLLLGLQDGRVLFMDQIVHGLKHFELQANKDAILELKFKPEYNLLMTRCHPRENALFQFWSLPTLSLIYEVICQSNITGHAMIDNWFMTGHSNGDVDVHQLTRLEADVLPSSLASAAVNGGPGDQAANPTRPKEDERKHEHTGPVVAVDACPKLEMFVTSGEDGLIKVWTTSKVLQSELVLDESLCATCFLNNKGDLLAGFKNHIFIIESTKVFPVGMREFEDDNIYEKESDIYEDPAIRYEGAAANPDPIDMENYLVPFKLEFSEQFLEGQTSQKVSSATNLVDSDQESDSESELSMAPTEIYFSPTATPRCLSQLDLTMTPDITKQDILEAEKRRKMRQSRDQESMDFEMPVYGISPGPTPPSTPTEVSMGEGDAESEEEGGSKEEAISTSSETRKVDTASQTIIKVRQPELKGQGSRDEVARPGTAGKSKYSLASYNIDVQALTQKKTVTKAKRPQQPTAPVGTPLGDPKQEVSGKPKATKQVVKKQKQERSRVKVTAKPSPKVVGSSEESGTAESTPVSISRSGNLALVPTTAHDPRSEVAPSPADKSREAASQPGGKQRKEPPAPGKINKALDESNKADKDNKEDKLKTMFKAIQKRSIAMKYRKPASGGGGSTTPSSATATPSPAPQVPPAAHHKPPAPRRAEVARVQQRGAGHHAMTPPATSVRGGQGSPGATAAGKVSGRTSFHPPSTQQDGGGGHVLRVADGRADLPSPSPSPSPSKAGGETAPLVVVIGAKPESGASRRSAVPPATKAPGKATESRWVRINEQLNQEGMVEQRPYTAPFMVEIKKREGDRTMDQEDPVELYHKYRSRSVTPTNFDKIFKNDGLHLEDNWQDRAIMRHQLIKMQKELRVQSAAEKRRLLELRKQERRKSLLGHHTCPDGNDADQKGAHPSQSWATQSDSTLHLIDTALRRCQSAGQLTPTPTPPASKPKNTFFDYKEQMDLASERPFRVRINQNAVKKKFHKEDFFEMGSAPPESGQPLLLKRPVSSKSIPSKCRRYILVSSQEPPPATGAAAIVPTPLEEQLLSQRFPSRRQPVDSQSTGDHSEEDMDQNIFLRGVADVDDFIHSAWM